MRIHKEGQVIVITVMILFISLYTLIAVITNWNSLYSIITFAVGILFLSFLLYFFRNPVRKPDVSPSVVYAPADGKLVAIEEVRETEYLNKRCLKISIFMSIWDVHVNRYPVSGRICYTKYHPGNYFIASHPKSSELNEHQTIVIETEEKIEIMVKQIAGSLARRVVCYAKKEQQVKQGCDLGFIRFGSRVDLFLPLQSKILVKMNEKVRGNRTIIACLN